MSLIEILTEIGSVHKWFVRVWGYALFAEYREELAFEYSRKSMASVVLDVIMSILCFSLEIFVVWYWLTS